MADAKITDKADGGAIQATDEFIVARAGDNKKIAGSQIPGVNGWIDDTAETWTFVSATSFKVAGVDVTAKYPVGTRIKLTQTTVKYFVVAAASFSTDTTVTITGGTDYTLANAAISANFHSYAASPQGYPGWFAFDPAPTGFSGAPTVTRARFSVVGRLCTIALNVTGTSNSGSFGMTAPVAAAKTKNFAPVYIEDAGGAQASPGLCDIDAANTAISVFRTLTAAGFTASGTKTIVTGAFTYEI